jgi:hypothetical protein
MPNEKPSGGIGPFVTKEEALAIAVTEAVRFAMAALRREFGERFDLIAGRVKLLEERPALEHRGNFASDVRYVRGNLITHRGSLWHCKQDVLGVSPGFDSEQSAKYWSLVAKAGRDGKDGR